MFKYPSNEELKSKTSEQIIKDIEKDTYTIDLMVWEIIEMVKELMAEHGIKYNPNYRFQPRQPRGMREGGQWTRTLEVGVVPIKPTEVSYNDDRDIGSDAVSDYPSNSRRVTPKVREEESIESTKITVPGADGKPVNRVNIFVGGFFDKTDHGNVRFSSSRKEIYGENYYITHDRRSDINKFISKLPKDMEVNLIGHSWGGDSATDIALDNPGRIKMLVTVDPTSIFRPDFRKVRNSVEKWININATGHTDDSGQRLVTGGDFAAGLGNSWDYAPESYAHVFINAPFSHEYFDDMIKYRSSESSSSVYYMLNINR